MSLWFTIAALGATFMVLVAWPWEPRTFGDREERLGRRIVAFFFLVVAIGLWLAAAGAYR